RRDYNTPVPPDYVCFYLNQAAAALDFLNAPRHRLTGNLVGIQHCDVKPSNLLLVGETVKLSDFGVSSVLTSIQAPQRPVGTPGYAAPEVYQGALTRWSDQYSLAVTYCELRTGRRPFSGQPPRFPADYVPATPDLSALPEDERHIVARALEPNPW